MSRLIDLLNQLIEEAVEDGGDPGGAYHQNQDGLRKAIQDLLDHLALSNYEVVDKLDCSKWSRLSIGEKDAVKHGHWVSIMGWISCSVCGAEPPLEMNYDSDYCPNCGAKMDEDYVVDYPYCSAWSKDE